MGENPPLPGDTSFQPLPRGVKVRTQKELWAYRRRGTGATTPASFVRKSFHEPVPDALPPLGCPPCHLRQASKAVKGMDSIARLPEFGSWLCLLKTV